MRAITDVSKRYSAIMRLGLVLLATASLLLNGCSLTPSIDLRKDAGPPHYVDVSKIPNAVPRKEPRSERGNPNSYVVNGIRYYVKASASGHVERGIASWYGTKFHGRLTSSGEPYNMYAMTAAHKTLPIPSYVEVTNLRNGRKIIVKVNDRGPFVKGRIIDLSYVAARKLGIDGTAPVEIRTIEPGDHRPVIMARRTPAKVVTRAAPQPSKPHFTFIRQANASETPPPGTARNRNHAGEPQLYLQVGAFSMKANAERLKKKLMQLPIPDIQIHATRVSGNPSLIYKVRVGPFANNQDADLASRILDRRGHAVSRIILN